MGLHRTKTFCTAKENINKIKTQSTGWETYLPIHLKRGWYKKCMRNLENWIPKKQTTQLKNEPRTWIDTSPKRTYRWPIDIGNDAECHQSSEKCQWKPQWDTISHLSEWLSPMNQQLTSAGEDVGKGEPLCTVGGKADWCSHCGKQYGHASKN